MVDLIEKQSRRRAVNDSTTFVKAVAVSGISADKLSSGGNETLIQCAYAVAECVGHSLVTASEERNLLAFKIKYFDGCDEVFPILLQIARAPGARAEYQCVIVSDNRRDRVCNIMYIIVTDAEKAP